MTLPAPLSELLRDIGTGDGNIVVLTGAGISAESGIPTFRGREGYWTIGSRNYQPMELATRSAFARMPEEIWRWYLYRRTICRRAPANAGHLALVDLERRFGDRFTLVTQNVDGLHLRAGSTLARTFQIHGNIDFHRWPAPEGPHLGPLPDGVGEQARDEPLSEAHRALLRGPDGSPSRPHVLWFDESYDELRFRAESAMQATREADVLIVVGTAGATNLPLQMAALARRRGIPIVDVNVDPDNPFAEAAAQSSGAALTGTASELLPRLRDALVS